jgi:hypothetical protein
MKRKQSVLMIVMFIVILLVCACTTESEPDSVTPEGPSDMPMVTLKVTRNYGREILIDKVVELEKNWAVYDLLEANTELSTEYGGSFVTGINGIESNPKGESGKRYDWFYFVNGISADRGIIDYDLSSGDIVWWDYHVWENMSGNNSTVVGLFPEPFVHGYNGNVGQTTIMSTNESEDSAHYIEQVLIDQGVTSIKIEEIDNDFIENRNGPVIVIGQWDELSNYEYLSNLNEAYERVGIFAHFNDDQLQLFDDANIIGMTLDENTGVILSHGDGLGDDCPLWLIIGIDSNGVGKAIDILANEPELILNSYGLAVAEDQIIRLPIE